MNNDIPIIQTKFIDIDPIPPSFLAPLEEDYMQTKLYNIDNRTSGFILGCVYTVVVLVSMLFGGYVFAPIENKLLLSLLVNIVAFTVVYLFSLFFQNASVSDLFWFIAPLGFAWYWFQDSGATDITSVMSLIVTTVYSFRHFVMYCRKFKGLSREDPKHSEIRRHVKGNSILYWAISYLYSHAYKGLLNFAGLVPLHYVFYSEQPGTLRVLIIGFATSMVGIIIQAISEDELLRWKKQHPQKLLDSGLWKYSRHPNYFGEFLFWLGLYFIVLSCDATKYWWTIGGPVAIMLHLAFPAALLSEIYLSRHKLGYRDYMDMVSRFMFAPRSFT
jgi:steroid 5-alpha reductase family enzyme